jgi:hypothetical protein
LGLRGIREPYPVAVSLDGFIPLEIKYLNTFVALIADNSQFEGYLNVEIGRLSV